MSPVCFNDIQNALPAVHHVLKPTALYEWSGLSKLAGCQVYLKHENHHPVGAFKVRGGVHFVGSLNAEERKAGILGCSTGNHGQSLAFACKHFGVDCTIVVPEDNNPDKNEAIQNLGAKLIEQGKDFDAAKEYLETELLPLGGIYVHSANEPKLIAGVGSMAMEIFEELPDPDAIIVPIGLGSGVCGTGIVARHLSPETKIIGVQASGADAVYQSWKQGLPKTIEAANTWAEGIATRSSAEMTLQIMREVMDEAMLVSDQELRIACYHILKQTHNLVEGAGAASVAAILQQREKFAGKKVVCILSGGNLDLKELPAILAVGK